MRAGRFDRSPTDRWSSSGSANRINAFDNMDEILTQRSQASMSDGGRSLRSLDASLRQRSSPSEVAGLMSGRVVRRHSKPKETSIMEDASSSSSVSEDLFDSRTNNFQPINDNSPQASRPGFLGCLGCFRTQSPRGRPTRGECIPSNSFCATVFQTLLLLSEDTEIETENFNDKRIVFLLFSALSGEPLLAPDEYSECDEWIDWLTLGYSSDPLDAFERDINRHGSQSLGLFLSLFFALQYTESARLCHLVIRNVNFDPSALFGLFAVNCAKWTRDVMMDALLEYKGAGVPEVFKPQIPNPTCEVFDWWTDRGGNIDAVEARFAPKMSSAYDSFQDDEDMPSEQPRNVKKSNSHKKDSRFRRVPPEMREILTIAGLYYSNCVLSFARFWLEKDLIGCNADVARERLNNAYLDREFVSKLRFSFNTDLARRNDGLVLRLETMWATSGWKKSDLVRQNSEE